MKDILEEAGIEISPDNKKQVDSIIHQIVKVEYKNCSPTWQKVKEQIKADPQKRAEFISNLKQELARL
jgi:hypothetical protein